MNFNKAFFILNFVAIIIGMSLALQAAENKTNRADSKEAFLNRIKNALDHKSKDDFVNLIYYHYDSSNDVKESNLMWFDELINSKVVDIGFEPLGNKDINKEKIVDCKIIKPTIPILGYVSFKYEKQFGRETVLDTLKMPYGFKDGRYFFDSVTDTLLNKDAPNYFFIRISGETSPTPVFFEGYCIYTLKGDKEARKHLKGFVPHTEKLCAQTIKSCEIQKISSHGWIHLYISKNGKALINSKQQYTNNPIIYKDDK